MNTSTTSGANPPPQPMYVRALYDYDADDVTSLSFHQGDVIQVITQLESGWWDGVINGVRGWFPSNYCEVVTGPVTAGAGSGAAGSGGTQNGVVTAGGTTAAGHSSSQQEAAGAGTATDTAAVDDADGDADEEDDFEYESDELDSEGNTRDASPGLPLEGTGSREQEEAAFWIPQATPDGRLFYFNTLTGLSTMELPLETPTIATETGPRDRSNVSVPAYTRPPPELMAGGFERDEDDTDFDEGNSASEREGESILLRAKDGAAGQKGSGAPVGTSGGSAHGPANGRTRAENLYQSDGKAGSTQVPPGEGANSGNQPLPRIPSAFYDDGFATPLTWNRLVDNMRHAIDHYRAAINNGERSEYVRRAEDISDHLRLLLAAGSSTTDNHSGNPSIISTNKALYPHFRDMMSKFSKLVLSSYIAATDWPPIDSYPKCLREADGVLNGVYAYVAVARQQRGEEIPRLMPGFLTGSHIGGNWQNNGLGEHDLPAFMDPEEPPPPAPTARLDAGLLARLDDHKKIIVSSIRRLDDQLILHDKVVFPHRHDNISSLICNSAMKILEEFRPWLGIVESINLSPLGSKNPNPALSLHNPQLLDFSSQKQRLYDLISDLIIYCQACAGPLGDEWSEIRGDPLEDRMKDVRIAAKQLETCTSQLILSLQLLLEMMPHEEEIVRGEIRRAEGGPVRGQQRAPGRPPNKNIMPDLPPGSFADDVDLLPEHFRKGENSKLEKIFGEMPPRQIALAPRKTDEIPDFLKLDHENELSYDEKTQPPQLRGGTLTALVEQLTRHDRLDSNFNNTFLLTYRSFTSAAELFDMLVKRFTIQPPNGLSAQELQMWVERKQKLIRFRLVNILKSWFENYWMEGNDEASKQLIRRVFAFAKDSVATTNTPGAEPLMAVLKQRMLGQETNVKRMVLTLNSSTPAPILPRNLKKLKFLDIDVTEFARQLTLIEAKLYGKIKPTECLNKTWQNKADEGTELAVNVKALIVQSNSLTNWVAQLILAQSDVRKRVGVVKHFISIADKCRNLNNFSTLTSIISAFSTAPIHRLKRTWEQTPQRSITVLEQMRRLMGSTKNFGEYRETLHLVNPPCIPFFGVYLTDLRFIEDGIPSIIKQTNLINFAKRSKTAEVILDIQQYQNVPYSLQPVPELQEYIVKNMQGATDVHDMYEKSLSVEPREREDERVTRLLSESGFL